MLPAASGVRDCWGGERGLSARNATFGGECPECAGKRTFVCSSAKVSYVPIGDIRRSRITRAMWHIAMPVEEPSTASKAVIGFRGGHPARQLGRVVGPINFQIGCEDFRVNLYARSHEHF